jgi:formiminotetrahydrofolate cyclodeaminase
MGFAEKSCADFISALASKEPAPGGGGASALMGAIGTALGNMVGSLTVGKKKYADVEAEILDLKRKSDELQAVFLALIDQDAEDFGPLARAYGLPKDTPEQQAEKDRIMEEALRGATGTPLEIMKKCAEAIDIIEVFAAKGSKLALSDAGAGVIFCRAALHGASLNVFINTRAMKDRDYAATLNAEADALIAKYEAKADRIFTDVKARLK